MRGQTSARRGGVIRLLRGAATRSGALVMAAAVAASGLALAAAPSPVRAEEPTLRIAQTNTMATASVANWEADLLYMRLSYSSLVSLNYGGTVGPEFAESWTTSPDGLTWTFKIRPGMKWSDGEPADANDAAFTLNYVLNSIGDKNELHGFVNPYPWKDADGKSIVQSVSAPDPLTLVVTTKHPDPLFLWKIFVVLPEHIWKDVTYAQAMGTFQADPPIVGSGPFIATEWKHDQYLRLTRNDNWWGPKPALKDILIVFYKTQDAAMQALQAGEVDLVMDASVNQFDQLARDPNIKVIGGQSSQWLSLDFNTLGTKVGTDGANTDAVADPAFRDAVNYAIDRQQIVDKVYGGHAEPGLGIVAPVDTADYNPMTDIARRFDLTEAARRLDAAGYALNADGVRLDKTGKPLDLRLLLDSGGSPEARTTAQFVVGWLAQVGIKVTPVVTDSLWDVLTTSRAWELSVSNSTLAPGPAIPQNTIDFYPPPDCVNCWLPAEFKPIYDKYMQTMDPTASRDLLDQMVRMQYQAAPTSVIVYPNLIQAYRTDRFTGWFRTPADKGPLVSLDGFSSDWALFSSLVPVGEATPAPSTAGSAAPSETVSSAAPVTPAPSPATSGTAASDAGPGAVLAAVVVVIALVAGALLLRRRRAG